MTKKPTYEELEQRVKGLEKEAANSRRAEEVLTPKTDQIDLANKGLENPHLVDGKYSIRDLIDIESLRETLEKFSLATGFTTGFLEYPSQDILIATGWRDICTKFHRAFPESAKHCKESNIYLAKRLKALKELNINPCENGLVDGATPIVIKGEYIAYLATGQVLFDRPDIKRFKKQAKIYGYDVDAYLEALSEVPVVREDQFKNALSFLSELAVTIAETGLNNLELKEKTRKLGAEITEKKQAQKALLESEEKYRSITESSLTGIFIHQNERFVFVNDRFAEIHGYTPDELLGKEYLVLIHPDEREEAAQKVARRLKKEPVTQRYEVKRLKKDGTTVWCEMMATGIDYRERPAVMGNVIDITYRKQTEESLLSEREQLLSIFNNINQIIYVTDPQTHEILYTNEALIKAFKKNPVGGLCYREFQGLDSPCDFCTNEIILKEKYKPYQWEYHNPILKQDYIITDMIIKWPDGRDVRFEIAIDITERKQAEEALRKRTKELDAKTRNLEELNSALKILLKQREEDKQKLEEKILSNVKHLVLPYLDKTKKSVLDDREKAFLEVAESNLNEIISPFAHKLSSKYLNLTPAEIQVADFVKYGKSTKEIATLLNLSYKTIESHRENIRTKLGIKHKKVNLQSYLLSLP